MDHGLSDLSDEELDALDRIAQPACRRWRAELARRRLIDFCSLTMPTYRAGRVHRFIAGQLERVERGEIDRLMLFCPPRTGKTELLIRFVAWCWGGIPIGRCCTRPTGRIWRGRRAARRAAVVASEEFGGAVAGGAAGPERAGACSGGGSPGTGAGSRRRGWAGR